MAAQLAEHPQGLHVAITTLAEFATVSLHARLGGL